VQRSVVTWRTSASGLVLIESLPDRASMYCTIRRVLTRSVLAKTFKFILAQLMLLGASNPQILEAQHAAPTDVYILYLARSS
jgi:hypothetical protein